MKHLGPEATSIFLSLFKSKFWGLFCQGYSYMNKKKIISEVTPLESETFPIIAIDKSHTHYMLHHHISWCTTSVNLKTSLCHWLNGQWMHILASGKNHPMPWRKINFPGKRADNYFWPLSALFPAENWFFANKWQHYLPFFPGKGQKLIFRQGRGRFLPEAHILGISTDQVWLKFL